ncbi:hypothetical protein VMCG_01432 [Cytospora schulzeri]|uniref:Involucrin repeat protein n=1 Tax=Cytospora schulzeri TaxID=448051 RepID=A0A423X6K5_9PEZI|nr:hypothetical protein VMCG_01432 [Valsa malicola]
MSDRRRRWSPESSRRRRKDRRVSREQLAMEEAAAAGSRSMAPESSYSNTSFPYPSQAQSQTAASSFQQTGLAADQHPLPPITLRSNDDTRTSMSTAAPMPMPMPMPGPSRDHRRERDRRRNRHGSRSSSDVSYSSSSSSSYLEISRWYPSFGRSGGVLKTFFQAPSEHRQKLRRRRSGRKKKGIFGFGNNSSSSSVNSDMAYGMGFVRKPKSRNFSPRGEHAASRKETSDGRPPRLQRRQTDEEIMEIGRKLAKVARDQNIEDLRAGGKRPAGQVIAAANSWDKFHLQNTGGHAGSSRGFPPSRPQRHDTSSSDDEEWESASEDESSSDESSGLAYGAVEFDEPLPPKPAASRQSTVASVRPPDRKSSAVDPRLFGPVNSLRGIVNTPCGFGDRTGGYPIPGSSEPRRASTAESASIEARPLQTVYPVQTSDPGMVEAARISGSVVPPQSSYSRDQSHPAGRIEPVPIQAPKPIAPVPMHMYEEERIHDEPSESREGRRFNPADSKTFVETALVTAGVAGAAILAGRERNKDKDRAPEHDQLDNYGHDDHREDGTKVEDSRRAKELALQKEIERLEKVLAERSKAREQRKRDSKKDIGAEERPVPNADADREMMRRGRDSRRSEPGHDYDYDRSEEQPEPSRVSVPSEQPAVVDDVQARTFENPTLPSSSGIDVFRFQVPDDAFRTRDSPLRPSSPFIIDVTPAPSPDPDEMERKSRRDSFEDEMRHDARHIYDESTKSTAPIPALDMAAAIAATEHYHPHDEPERGRTNAKQRDAIQEEADRYYHARRMAEREVRSRSRSHSPEPSVVGKYGQDQGAEIPRIVTPPEMLQKPQKNIYSEPNADVIFDHLMSPEDHVFFKPKDCPVRDPSAERPRPVLTLIIPTPVPTPSPEMVEKRSDARAPETILTDAPDLVIGPRGEVIEVVTASPDSKRVSWGPSETKQYEVESPERSRERPSEFSETPKRSSKDSSWGGIAAALAGAGAAAAFFGDDEPERFEHQEQTDDIKDDTPLDAARSSPPRDRKVLPKGMSSRVLDEEPEDAPPAPGPKPASPRNSQMPGAFADDLDFAATLAAGLQDSGFDPNIVIDDDTYRRRDSPPGLNEPTEIYIQPFVETVPDLGIFGIDEGVPVREPGHVIGEVAETPASEKGPPLDELESAPAPRRQSQPDERRSTDLGDIEAIGEATIESPKLSKKEQRKLEKATRAAQLAEEEERAAQPVDAGDDKWEDALGLKKSKKSPKKSKRSSAGWDDADTPVNDKRVSLPGDDLEEDKPGKASDDTWKDPKGSRESKRDSRGYDLPEEYPVDRRERRREERRRSQFSEPLDRDATSVKSETRDNEGSTGLGRDDDKSVVSGPDSKRDSTADKRSSKEEKRGSGGLWGLLKGSNGTDGGKESKKGSAGTLGAGAGLAGAALGAVIAAGSLPSSSDAAEAPLKQEEPFVIVDVNQPAAQRADSVSGQEHLLMDDPDIAPRVIKPAIDPQYGDLLPLPPSPGEVDSVDSYVDDELPPLPDSRPETPLGQEKTLFRERSESSQKRHAHATHTRRRSTHETPTKSPSHTAIPLQFRMGPRTSVPPPPGMPRTPSTGHPSPAAPSQDTFPSTKRQSRPTSWDRPMSWDTSKEIRPLYLLERSRGGEQDNDDTPERTPLPPSSESSAPQSEHGEELEASPLIIDTAVARAAPLGSEESTPRGIGGTNFDSPASAKEFEFISPEVLESAQTDWSLSNLGKDPEITPVQVPGQSSLAGSSYATPFESPSDNPEGRHSFEHRESTESTPDFRDALDAPADDEDTDTGSPKKNRRGKKKSSQTPELELAEEQEKKGYFPSVLSMLPAATFAGVDALLGRGKRDELPTDVDKQTSETQAQELPTDAPDQRAERGVLPRAEASDVEVLSPVGPANQGHPPPAASPRKSPIDTPLSTIDASDASLPNDSPAVHMHPERSLSTDDMRASEGVVRDVSGGISELPAQESPAIETAEVLPTPLSSHTIDDSLTTTSPANRTEDMEPILETPADTIDWVSESDPPKQSIPDIAQVPVTAEASVIPPSGAQRDATIQDESLSKSIEAPSSAIEAIATSPIVHHSDEPFQEDAGAETSTSSGAKGKEPEDSLCHPPEENARVSLIHEVEAMPVTFESPTSPGAHSRTQSQDEATQAGGRQIRSSAASRRLRSSRVGMSPSNSVDEYMSSDAVHSGEEVPTSPRSTTSSGLRSAGRSYKKTRSLRSSRRSSMASSQGSTHENEAAPVEGLIAEQPIAAVPEQTRPEVIEGAERQLDVEDLEPAGPAVVDDSVPRQRENVEEPVPSRAEIVEKPDPSPYEIIEEPVLSRPAIDEEPSIAHPEEPSPTQPEDPQAPFSAQSGFVSELNDSPAAHVPGDQEDYLSQTPKSDKNEGLIEGPIGSPEPETFVEKEVAGVQEPDLPESSTLGVDIATETAREVPAEELPQDQRPQELAGSPKQSSETDKVQDILQQQVEVVSSAGAEEQGAGQSSDVEVEEATRDITQGESPVHRSEQTSELEQPITESLGEEGGHTTKPEDSPEVQPQELESAPVSSMEEGSPASPDKPKDSTVIDENTQSIGAAILLESDSIPQATGAPAEPTSPIQAQVQLEHLPSEDKDISSDQGIQPELTETTDAREMDKSLEPQPSVEESSEPPIEFDSALKTEGRPETVLDNDEVAPREAEAALVREEEAELARLRQKKKRKSKDNKRISELVANAERRAEKADMATAPAPSIQEEGMGQSVLEGNVAEPQLEEAIPGDYLEERNLPQTEVPTMTEQGDSTDRTTVVTEPEKILAQPEIIPQVEEAVPETEVIPGYREVDHQPDQVTPSLEPQPELGKFEDPAEFARHEAETALIQKEEADLARLVKKKNPSKKDKARIKVLKANAVRRAQESEIPKDTEATGPSHIEEAVSERAESPQVQDADDVPPSQAEGISSVLQGDNGDAGDLSRPQLEETSQPQIEEVAPSQVENPPVHTNSPIAQPGSENATNELPQDQPEVPRGVTGIPESQLDNNSHVPLEPVPIVESSPQQEQQIPASPTVAGTEQPTVTEIQQELEPVSPVTSKKSKKDKKKKRKGTISDESGQTLEPATPLAVAEPSAVGSRELSEPASLPAQDSEAASVPTSSEATVMEQGQSSVAPLQEDNVTRELSTGEAALAQPTESSALKSQDQTSSELERSIPTPFEEGKDPVAVSEPKTESDSPLATKESEKDKDQGDKRTISEGSPQPSGSKLPVALDDTQQEITSVEPVDESAGFEAVEDHPAPLEVTTQPESVSSPTQEPPSISNTRETEPAQEEEPGISAAKEMEKDEKSRTETLSGTVTPIVGVGETSSPTAPVDVQTSDPTTTEGPDKEALQTSEPNWMPSVEEASGSADPINLPETATETRTEGSSTTATITSKPEQPVAEPAQTSPSGRKSDGWGFLAGAIAGIGAAVGLSEDDKPLQGDEQVKDATAEQDPFRGIETSEELPSQDPELADVVEHATMTTLKREEESLQKTGRDQPQEQTSTGAVMTEPETTFQDPEPIHDDLVEPVMSKPMDTPTLDFGSENIGSSGKQSPVHDDVEQDVARQASVDINTASQPLDTAQNELHLLKSDLKPVDSGQTVPVTEREIADQPLEESAQPQTAEDSLASETIQKPELERKIDEMGDSLIVTGGGMPDEVSGSTQIQQDWPISAEQAKELAGVDDGQPYTEPGSSQPAADKGLTDTFATPMEHPPLLSNESGPIHARTSRGQTEEASDNKSSGSPRQSLEIGPEVPTSVPETPLFEEALEQQPAMESTDTKEVDEKDIELTTEDVPSPKKLSKKEKRKAKKGSISVSEPEDNIPAAQYASQQAIELAQPQTISEHQDQAPADLNTSSDTQLVGPSQQEVSHEEETSGDVSKTIEEQGPERLPDVQDMPPHLRGPPTQVPPDEIATEVPAHGHPQPSSDQPIEPHFSELQGTAVEDTPVLARKLSKKEKRRAKKAASAWENDVIEPSQPQTPLAKESQPQDIPATPSPVFKSDPIQTIESIESQPPQDVTDSAEMPVAKDVVAEDEWSAPLSRRISKKDEKKGKQPASEPDPDPQTPLKEEVPVPRTAEMIQQVPETQEMLGQIPEDTGEPTIDHRSAEVYVPVAEEKLGQTTGDFGEPTSRVDHRSAEIYVPEAQETLGEPIGHSDHRSAEVYIPGTQETLEQTAADTEGPTGRGHRSAEVYVPVARRMLGRAGEDPSTPTSRTRHRSAEMYIPESETGIEGEGAASIEGSWKMSRKRKGSLVTGDSIPITPVEDEAPGTSDGAEVDSEFSSIGRELQKRKPSPDIWDNDDYFEHKPDNSGAFPHGTFDRFEIHPAVAREFNTNPEKRMKYDRPLVGLGLIRRHSSIFREADGHTPRLLTMASDNSSTDSLAIRDDPSEPDTSTVMDSMPVQEDISTSHNEPTASTMGPGKDLGKDFSDIKPDPKQPANAPSAQRITDLNLNDRQQATTASTRPSHGASQETSIPEVKDLAKKGGVAALAEKFGGTKRAHGKTKQIPNYVDQGSPRDDDNFDEPAIWEGAERRPFESSRLDVDSDNFWAVPDTKLEDEQLEPDVLPGQGTSSTSHGRETQFGDDNVSETRSQPSVSDARKFTPQVPEPASPKAEIHLEEPVVVESPVPSQKPTIESPMTEPQLSVEPPDKPPDLDSGQMGDVPASITETADTTLNEFRDAPYGSPSPQFTSPASESPASEKGVRLEEPVLPDLKTTDDDALSARPSSAVSFRRSISRGLPPVREEPQEEDLESGNQGISFSPGAVTPDINRDSGFVTDSPIFPRLRQSERAHQQRDSGVHMRDSPGTSPKLLSTRGFSPQPARLSQSSLEDEGANLELTLSRQPSPAESETQRRLRETTPILEAQEPPVTPEPQKSRPTSHKKYPDLGPSPGKTVAAAAIAGGAALLTREALTHPAASERSVSDKIDQKRVTPEPLRRVVSNTAISRTRTPEPLNLRPESPFRHSGTPPLRSRRTRSGDLRSLGQSSNRSHSHSDLVLDSRASPAAGGSPASASNNPGHATHRPTTPSRSPTSSDLKRATSPAAAAQTNNTPVANEGRVRAKDMADVYDGFGEGRLGSPRSPTRPHSMRRRQSMQVLELESRVDQLVAENRALQEAKAHAQFHTTSQATSTLADRDTEIEALKQSLEFMRKEIQRLTEVNEGLNSAIQQTAVQYDDRYRLLESQHAEATRELHEHRSLHGNNDQADQIIEEKDAEIRSLREQLEATKDHIREMQAQILASKPADSGFLRIKDVDYFDHRCQQLCSHVQQWVLRFSKFSDMRACRLTNELNDEKIIDRLDNAVLDGSNVDHYLNDRVRRRDVFMSVTMTMIWEFVFTRYLFGMDREQRQKLKALEKLLLEVGPSQAVRQWRAVTLTLLSKREAFKDQRDQDTEAVVQAIFQTLSMILPPPSHLEDQIQTQLRRVMREAVDLSVEMRTQRAEYMMLPPLQPDYDANGDLAEPHPFNAALMNERSPGADRTADDLEAEGAIVRVVLFPLVVKKGDDDGVGDDEIVVCPAQVIVARPRSKSRQSYRSDAGGVSLIGRGRSPSTGRSRSNVSMRDVEGMEGAI